MSRPTEFRAGGFKWKIKYISHKDWPTEDNDAMGVHFGDRHTVHIRLGDEHMKYGKDALKETFLHELMHVCWFLTSMNQDKEPRDEERTIQALSPSLLAVLRDNLALSKWLLT